MRAVRIWYKKYGTAKFISHLDLYRCLCRAVRRAGIPLWYTEGFNPRPYLNILMALPLGQEADCEPVDIRIEGEMSDEEIAQRLNSVLPSGIEIVRAGTAECMANEIAYALYDISLAFESVNKAMDFAAEVSKLIESGELLAEKASKKGGKRVIKQINLCESIAKFNTTADNSIVSIKAVLSAGNTANLNPDLLTSAMEQALDIHSEYTNIVRRGLLKQDFSEFR